MVAVSESNGLTARQSKRKDWWKLRRAKSKSHDGSSDSVGTREECVEDPAPATTETGGSSDPVGTQQECVEDPGPATTETEADVMLEITDTGESTDTVCQKSVPTSGVKGGNRKRSSVVGNTEVVCKVQKVEQKDTPKESKAAKRRKRLQKLKLYQSQETSTVCSLSVEIKDEFHAKASDKSSGVEETKCTTKPLKTSAVATGQADGPINENSQQPGQKKKKGKFPKLYIAFVGNLPYDVKEEDVKWHFNKEGGVKDVRMLTVKDTSKPRGCAFVEFVNNASLMRGIDLHHSQLGWRTINVEVSARGKGKNNKSQPRSRVRTKHTDGRKHAIKDFSG